MHKHLDFDIIDLILVLFHVFWILCHQIQCHKDFFLLFSMSFRTSSLVFEFLIHSKEILYILALYYGDPIFLALFIEETVYRIQNGFVLGTLSGVRQ